MNPDVLKILYQAMDSLHGLALLGLGTLTLWWLIRMFVFRHYQRLAQTDLHAAKVPHLLPTQERFVKDMAERLSRFDLDRPGPLWAIQGRWGDGKSFLVRALQAELENRSQTADQELAVIYLDVWRHQTERDLHWAMVEAICSNPKVLQHGFSSYPVFRLMLRHLAGTLNRFVTGLSLKAVGMEMSMGLAAQQVLPLMAQRDLEQVVACLRLAGVRIVVILDEIDRATPAAAQAAIVLTRRALNLPGLAVVMPYVHGQLEAKVFSPLQVHVPELYQTFMAHVATSVYLDDRQRPQLRRTQDDPVMTLLASEPASTTSGEPTASAPSKPDTGKDLKPAASEDGEKPKSNAEWRQRQLEGRLADFENRLLLAFDRLPAANQRLLKDQTQEKYLSLRAMVPELSAEDAAGMLAFDTIRPSLPNAKALPDDLDKCVIEALRELNRTDFIPPKSAPTVRHLEGQWVVALDLTRQAAAMHMDRDLATKEEVLRAQVATAAVVAWLTAQVKS